MIRVGRLSFYVDQRDCWVGVYVADEHLYICLLPTLVMRWDR